LTSGIRYDFASTGLGINVTSPTARLHIRGSGATSSTTAFRVENANASSSMVVLDDGNVGIGTTAPAAKLDIRINQANTNTVPYLNLINDASGYVGYTFKKVGSNDLGLYGNYTVPPAMVWKYISGTDSYVGVGTTTPSYKLDVSGSGRFTNNLTVTGSLTISGSSTLTNIGPAIFSGSFVVTEGITGSFSGSGTIENASFASTASYVNPLVQDVLITGSTFISSSNDTQLQVGNNLLFVSSSGNVGIGTTSPTSKLDVNGNIRTLGVNGLFIDASANFGDNSGGSIAILNLGSTRALRILGTTGNGWGNILLNPYGGTVGVGTLTPTAKLQVKGSGTTSATTAFRVENANASGSVVVLDNGNVGIGTTSPSYKLDVETSDDIIASFVSTDNKASITINDNDTSVYVSAENSRASFGFNPGVNVGNLNVDPLGNVGIGTSSPTFALEVSGSGGNQGVIRSRRLITYGGTAGDPAIATNSTIAGLFEVGYAQLGFSSYGGEAGRIETNARLWNIGMTGGTAKMNIRGTGATSATRAFRVENANASSSLSVLDNGAVAFGGNTSNYITAHNPNGGDGINPNLTSNGLLFYSPRTSAASTGIWLFNHGLSDTGGTDAVIDLRVIGGVSTADKTILYTSIASTPVVNNTGGAVTLRGFYFAPSITNATGTTLNAFESTRGNILFQSGSTPLLFVSESGRVGIGTSFPSSSLHISGASAVLTLSPQDPLPSGVPTGSFAVSSSAPPKPYFYDGTTWNALY
jgi:hypothetical protein